MEYEGSGEEDTMPMIVFGTAVLALGLAAVFLLATWVRHRPLTFYAKQCSSRFVLALVLSCMGGVTIAPDVVLAYDGNAAVAYADAWATGRNLGPPRNYGSFNNNDCTNFISQALYAGGLPEITPGSYGIQYWWWDPMYGTGSESWAAADWLNQHVAQYQGVRFDYMGNFDQLQPGDFFLMDLVGQGYPTHGRIWVGWGQETATGNGNWTWLIDQHTTDEYHYPYDWGLDLSQPIYWWIHVR